MTTTKKRGTKTAGDRQARGAGGTPHDTIRRALAALTRERASFVHVAAITAILAALEESIRADEREACAKVADDAASASQTDADALPEDSNLGWRHRARAGACRRVAAAIRSRAARKGEW